jgi:hypothetical protein
MAIEQLTPLNEFENNYEVHNGMIADAATLNLAVHRAQQEIISLWNFVRSNQIDIDDSKTLIDDIVSSSSEQVRSIDGLHNEIFDGGTWS